MVDSWDAATGKLVTIEGNVMEGLRPGADGEPQRVENLEGRPLRSTRTSAPSSTVVEVRDMNSQRTPPTPSKWGGPQGRYEERGAQTVFGVGRPSLVDFESHVFGMQPIPEKYRYTSPEDMRRLGQGDRIQKQNTMQAP